MGFWISINTRQNSQDVAENTTNVTVEVIGRWTDGYYNRNVRPGKLTVDGTTYSFKCNFNWYGETTGSSVLFTKTMDVVHEEDGTKTLNCSASYDCGLTSLDLETVTASDSVVLSPIPRSASLTSAADVTLGKGCSVKWTPAAASHRFRLTFSLKDWSCTTGPIHPNKTTAYTYTGYIIPLEAAGQIPDGKTGIMSVTLYTYADSDGTNQVGSASSGAFTVTVPDNSDTKPFLAMSLAPVNALPSAFDGLYILGFSKVKATLTAEGKYGATAGSGTMKVDGVSYDAGDDFTSGYLTPAGTRTVYGYVTDSRGHSNEISQDITVLPYSNPRLLDASAYRCDADGNAADTGTCLRIHAKRSYSPLVVDGTQKNFCGIMYRYGKGDAFSDWVTILEGSAVERDEVTTGALLNGALSPQESYMIHLRAVDDMGRYADTYIGVLTEKVYMHRDGARNALALGKYVEEDNLLDVAWDAHFRGEVKIGATGMTLKEYILAVISEGG